MCDLRPFCDVTPCSDGCDQRKIVEATMTGGSTPNLIRKAFDSVTGQEVWRGTDPLRDAIPEPRPNDFDAECGDALKAVQRRINADWREPLRAILADAGRLVEGDRSAAYGRPLENHERIAALWRVWLADDHIGDPDYEELPLTAADAAMMMLLVKVARLMESPDHRDSITDLIGYALVYADCVGGGE